MDEVCAYHGNKIPSEKVMVYCGDKRFCSSQAYNLWKYDQEKKRQQEFEYNLRNNKSPEWNEIRKGYATVRFDKGKLIWE